MSEEPVQTKSQDYGKKYDPNGEDTKNQSMYTGANGSLPGSSSGKLALHLQQHRFNKIHDPAAKETIEKIISSEPSEQEIAETAEFMRIVRKFTDSYHRNKTELHRTSASDYSCPNVSRVPTEMPKRMQKPAIES
ncbi:unnamed protein product [Caenorhabditis nigoni]